MTCSELERLWKANRGKLFSFARKYRKSAEDCEDVLAEVFTEMYRRHESIDAARFYNYAVRCVQNRMVDLYRRTKPVLPLANAEQVEDRQNDPLIFAFDSEVHRLLEELLQDLPAGIADAMRLLVQGHSYEQISSRLSIPIGTVRSRVSRGRRALYRHAEFFTYQSAA